MSSLLEQAHVMRKNLHTQAITCVYPIIIGVNHMYMYTSKSCYTVTAAGVDVVMCLGLAPVCAQGLDNAKWP